MPDPVRPDEPPGPQPEPLAWTGRTRAPRTPLLLVPVMLFAVVIAVGLLPTAPPAPTPSARPSSAPTVEPSPAVSLPTAPPSHDLTALRVRCVDVAPLSCQRLATAAAEAVDGDAVSAAVWSSLVCGVQRDCPTRLLNANGTMGSVILTMADNRRWVANVNTGRTAVGDAAPVVVLLGWPPGT